MIDRRRYRAAFHCDTHAVYLRRGTNPDIHACVVLRWYDTTDNPDSRDNRVILHWWAPERYHAIGADELGSNAHHPSSPAWNGTRDALASVARCNDVDVEQLIAWATSTNPTDNAKFEIECAMYYGAHEFDAYPRELTRKEQRRL